MQLLIVIITLLAAAAYAVWRIYKVLTWKGKGCVGCPLQEVCDNKGNKLSRRNAPPRPNEKSDIRHKR